MSHRCIFANQPSSCGKMCEASEKKGDEIGERINNRMLCSSSTHIDADAIAIAIAML